MLYPGLVSVTFRKLSPREITELVVRAGLRGIEWGGDVHVPHGDLARACEVRRLTEAAGLTVAAYGSYYRVGASEPAGLAFDRVLETAVQLGAPLIRVWAGGKGSAEADAAYRAALVEDTRRIAEMAAPAGITVAYEFHGNTLTDTAESTRDLIETVAHPNLKTLWQPRHVAAPGRADDALQANLADLGQVLPWLANIHVFYWTATDTAREQRPLAEGQQSWRRYLKQAAAGQDRYALLEFVRGESPEAFAEDARVVREWLRGDL